MARNGSGTYTVPNTFVAGNTITAAGHNQNWQDLSLELTNSIAADGQTPITAALKGANGSASVPAYGFNSDPNTGTYRHGTDELGFATNGTAAGYFDAAQKFFMLGAADIAGALNVTGAITIPAKSFAISKFADTTANSLFGTDGSGVWTVVSLGNGVALAAGVLTATAQLPRGYIDGCVLSNGSDTTNDINITAGSCRDSTNAVDIVVSANTSGKQLDANWAVSGTTNSGMRNSAAGIANSTYHVYAARTAASSTATIYAFAGVAGTDPDSAGAITTMLTALQAESGGSSYIYARRLGSIVRSGAAIIQFAQIGDTFRFKTPTADINTSTLGTTSTNFALASIPLGISVLVAMNVMLSNATGATVYLRNPNDTDTAPSSTIAPLGSFRNPSTNTYGIQNQVYCNSSAQIAARSDNGSTSLVCVPIWFVDQRGKNS